MARSVQKITLSLPAELADHATYLASRFGVSRSALVSELLSQPIAMIYEVMSALPENPTPDEVTRYRGAAAEILRTQLEEMQNSTADLFRGAAE